MKMEAIKNENKMEIKTEFEDLNQNEEFEFVSVVPGGIKIEKLRTGRPKRKRQKKTLTGRKERKRQIANVEKSVIKKNLKASLTETNECNITAHSEALSNTNHNENNSITENEQTTWFNIQKTSSSLQGPLETYETLITNELVTDCHVERSNNQTNCSSVHNTIIPYNFITSESKEVVECERYLSDRNFNMQPRSTSCKIKCKVPIKQNQNLITHHNLTDVLSEDSTDIRITPYSCQLCKKQFISQLYFFEHLKEHYEPNFNGHCTSLNNNYNLEINCDDYQSDYVDINNCTIINDTNVNLLVKSEPVSMITDYNVFDTADTTPAQNHRPSITSAHKNVDDMVHDMSSISTKDNSFIDNVHASSSTSEDLAAVNSFHQKSTSLFTGSAYSIEEEFEDKDIEYKLDDFSESEHLESDPLQINYVKTIKDEEDCKSELIISDCEGIIFDSSDHEQEINTNTEKSSASYESDSTHRSNFLAQECNTKIIYNIVNNSAHEYTSGKVFIKKLHKNSNGNLTRNKGHHCVYCHIKFINLYRHLKNKHSKETEVKKILCMPLKSNVRRKHFGELAKIGDFYHNCEVIKRKEGELILVRRPTPEESKCFSYKDYGPCPDCLGFLLKKHLWRHARQHHLKAGISESGPELRRITLESDLLLAHIYTNEEQNKFEKKILSKIKNDNINDIAKNDPLILKFGLYQFKNLGSNRCEMVKHEVRQLGRLVLQLRKLNGRKKFLSDWLQPSYFSDIVESVKVLAKEDTSISSFEKPTVALKLGICIKKCIGIERGYAVKNCNNSKSEILKSLLKLMGVEWSKKISSKAHAILTKRKTKTKESTQITIKSVENLPDVQCENKSINDRNEEEMETDTTDTHESEKNESSKRNVTKL